MLTHDCQSTLTHGCTYTSHTYTWACTHQPILVRGCAHISLHFHIWVYKPAILVHGCPTSLWRRMLPANVGSQCIAHCYLCSNQWGPMVPSVDPIHRRPFTAPSGVRSASSPRGAVGEKRSPRRCIWAEQRAEPALQCQQCRYVQHTDTQHRHTAPSTAGRWSPRAVCSLGRLCACVGRAHRHSGSCAQPCPCCPPLRVLFSFRNDQLEAVAGQWLPRAQSSAWAVGLDSAQEGSCLNTREGPAGSCAGSSRGISAGRGHKGLGTVPPTTVAVLPSLGFGETQGFLEGGS